MKKPETTPAPTPLEMAQRILEAQAAEIAAYRAYIDGIDKPGARERYSEWNRVRESYLSVLALFGPQVATARTTPDPSADTPKGRKDGKRAVMSSEGKAKRHDVERDQATNAPYVEPARPVTFHATNVPFEGGGRRLVANHIRKEDEPAVEAFLKNLNR